MGESRNNESPSEGSIAVSLHAIDPDRLDVDALAAGVAAAVNVTKDPELRIVVSGAFEEYVRERDHVLAELPPYKQMRVRGQAVGKILTLVDGSRTMLVDASVLDVDRAQDEDPVRTFMHEALHLVIDRRGESTCGRRARLGYEPGTAVGAFAGVAGHIGEEYRVERALREAGRPLDGSYRAQLGAVADDYAATLTGPLRNFEAKRSEDAMSELLDVAARGFEDLTPVVAYLIGDDVGAGVRQPPPTDGDGPAQWFGVGYGRLYEPLAALPSATTPCTIEDLDEMLEPVTHALQDWFAAIGFRWTGGPVRHRLNVAEHLRRRLSAS